MKLGLCLSGGGVKGAAHIGVLKAIEENGIKIDYISGTSSGSIIAALYAMGYKAEEILYIFKKYGSKIRYYDYKNLIKLVLGIIIKKKIIIEGLTDGKEIETLMKKMCTQKNIIKIKDSKIPLLIPAVNLQSGETYFFSSELKRKTFSNNIQYKDDIDIPDAVRASCSYPGVFTPYKINGNKFIDGGIRENTPWKGLKEIGADYVISVVFEKQIKEKKQINLVDVIETSLDLMGQELSNYELEGADKIIKIKTHNVKLLQIEKTDELYKQGYIKAKNILSII